MKAKRSIIALLISLLFFSACSSGASKPQEETQLKKFPFTQPLNIAHRGARSLAPENTLLAAQKGFDSGADLWELDVAMSYDGEIVVIHDDTLGRTSNAREVYPKLMPWNVHTFTFAELRRLDMGSWFVETDPFKQIQAGAVSTAELEKMKAVPIPTLREALEFTRAHHWHVNVEIKDLTGLPGDREIVENVVALIEELDMRDRVIISSFNHSYIVRSKAADPQIITAALVESAAPDPIALLLETGAQAYNPSLKAINDFNQIREIREAGFDVYVWTVNDEDTMRKLIDAGVSGIFTDFPQLLNKVLAEYNIK
ncbi:MAG: glycerophosphodiester phosphodiesterase family protein [Anaerolineaceae bacterium]